VRCDANWQIMAGPQYQQQAPISCVSSSANQQALTASGRPVFPEGLNTEEFVTAIANNKDIENGTQAKRLRHKHHRPLYRRLYNYLREAWAGATFSATSGMQMNIFILTFFPIR
jgi:hypothetical protein